MKKFVVKCDDHVLAIEAEVVDFNEQEELYFAIKDEIVAAFRNWDYWYEES
jgi:hypothetical protein